MRSSIIEATIVSRLPEGYSGPEIASPRPERYFECSQVIGHADASHQRPVQTTSIVNNRLDRVVLRIASERAEAIEITLSTDDAGQTARALQKTAEMPNARPSTS